MTFVGETHIYNDKESEFSRDFIRQFDVVFYEGSGSKFHSLPDGIFLMAISVPYLLSTTYFGLADGRYSTNPQLHELASQNGIPLAYLEVETGGGISEFTYQQKAKIWGYFALGAAIGPALYYMHKSDVLNPKKNNNARSSDVKEDVARTVNSDLRNAQMIYKLLE